MTLFELELVGGPWGRRLARRRASIDELPWNELDGGGAAPEAREGARWVWTQSAFSEYASAAAFAEIGAALLAAGAPLDLVAAAGDFLVEELVHVELCARVATALGGAVALDVDLTRLVRPPASTEPLVRAAELLVRTSCVGEALTVPVLKSAKAGAGAGLVGAVIGRILEDEGPHAELGPWFLDWAADRLSGADRAHLGRVAGAALRDFAPVLAGACAAVPSLGVLDCGAYDTTFARAVAERVVRPLGARGIEVPPEDLAAVRG